MRGIRRGAALLAVVSLILGGAVAGGAPASATDPDAPLFLPPSVEITPLARYNYQRLLRISWHAADSSGTQLDRVEIWMQTGYSQEGRNGLGAEYQIATTPEASSGSITTPAIPGAIQCMRAIAVDAIGGTTSTPQTCTETPIDTPSPSGYWRTDIDRRYLGGTVLTTATKGRRIDVYPSRGITRIGVLAVTCPTCGALEIWGMGGLVGKISLVNTVTVRRLLILPRTDPRSVAIVFKVVSSGRRVSIDGLLLSTY
jgi:hypothetical protein